MLLWLLAQSESGGSLNLTTVSLLLSALAAVGASGVGAAAWRGRKTSEQQVQTATEDIKADTVTKLTKANAEFSDLLEERMDSFTQEQARLRDKNALLVAEKAEVEAKLAREIAERGVERHDLQELLGLERMTNSQLEKRLAAQDQQIAELRGQVEALQAQLDVGRHGRRRDDPNPKET